MKKLIFTVLIFVFFGQLSMTARAESLYAATSAEISLPPGTLIRHQKVAMPALYRAKAWKILYVTRDYADRPIAATGYVVLPDKAAANVNDRHIIGWAHPTTGIAQKCAPTLQQTPIKAILGINELVAMGHVIAATDYPGLGTKGPTGYLVGQGQAHAIIDSVRAARQLQGVSSSKDYALWGYSQGGHAVAFASLVAQDYAPELRLKGIAAVAPPSNLAALILADEDTLSGHVLSSFTLGSWSRKYGVPLSTLLKPTAIKAIEKINQNCISNFEGLIDVFKAQEKLGADFRPSQSLKTAPWRNFIAINSISGLSSLVPALILQGTNDEIVRPDVTRRFIRNSCRNGARVKYVELPGLGHGKSATASITTATNWLNDRLTGKPAQSSCH